MGMLERKECKIREWLDAIEDARAALANFGLYLHKAKVLGTTDAEFHAELRKVRDRGLEGWVDGPMDIDETYDLLMGHEPEEPEGETLNGHDLWIVRVIFGENSDEADQAEEYTEWGPQDWNRSDESH